MKLVARYKGGESHYTNVATVDITVEVICFDGCKQCNATEIVVDPDVIKSFEYNIGYPEEIHYFDTSLATTNGADYCPGIFFEVNKRNN